MPSQSVASQTSQNLKLQEKITWICQVIRWLAIIWLIWILAIILKDIFNAATTVDRINAVESFKNSPVTPNAYIASRCVGLFDWACAVPIGIAVWLLMSGYLSGDIFSERAAQRMKRVGQAAIFAELISMISRPLSTWIFSSNYFQTVQIWDYLIPQDLLYLLIGTFILGLARIFCVAAEINAENKEFV